MDVSSKPWHLTFSDEEKLVLLWKSGSRMKLKDGSSSGPVTATSFLEADVVNVSHIVHTHEALTMHGLSMMHARKFLQGSATSIYSVNQGQYPNCSFDCLTT